MNYIKLLDQQGNPINLDNTKSGQTFREIAPNLPRDCSFEDMIIVDVGSDKIISKFQKQCVTQVRLSCERMYKILISHQIYKQLTIQAKLALDLGQQTNTLLKKNAEIQEELQSLKGKLTKLESCHQQSKQNLEQQTDTINTLVEKIAEQKKQIEYLTQQVNDLLIFKQRTFEMQDSYQTLEHQYKLVVEQNTQYEKELRKSNNEKDQQDIQIKELQEKIKRQRLNKKEKDAKYDKLVNQTLNFLNVSAMQQNNRISESLVQMEQSANLIGNPDIENLKFQNKDFEGKISELEQKIKQTKDKYEQKIAELDSELKNKVKQWNEALSKSQNQVNELKRQVDSSEKVKKDYLKNIEQMDTRILQQNEKIQEYENSGKEIIYRTRLIRLIETQEKPHINEINFSIEEVFNLRQYQSWEEDEFEIHEIVTSKLGTFYQRIYEPNDLNFQAHAYVDTTLRKQRVVKGRVQSKNISSQDNSYDEIKIFQCLQNFGEIEKDQMFALKIIKGYKEEEMQHLGTAVDECLGLLIAQNMLEQFYLELGQQGEFRFQKPYIISRSEPFKVYIKKKIGIEQFQNIFNFIQELSKDESDEFYNSIRQAQLNKDVESGSLQMLLQCIEQSYDESRYKSIKQKLLELNQLLDFKRQLKEFFLFLDEIYFDQFPICKYYPAYKIHNSNNQPFIKYNGGLQNFDTSSYGKFLSAFSYYTIKKSHNQVCVSHIQGVGQELYDPLVSTYDGFLNKLDQGINEMRLIESKYETAKPEDICEKYINKVGFTRNKKQILTQN